VNNLVLASDAFSTMLLFLFIFYHNVAFGDDSSAKILGEGVVELGRKNVKEKNVLLVEDLKHNLLSVSKMCDQGYTLTFDSRKCKIRENNSGRLVATATRRPNNIYILDMKKREKTKSTQKDSKEEKVPKTKNKDEVLLSATCSGGAAPKKRVTFFIKLRGRNPTLFH
jgi:hypothetical protein